MMAVRHRQVVTVLAIALAGAVTFLSAGTLSPPVTGRAAADSLSWWALRVHGRTVPADRRPRIVLYVAPSCPHCNRAATTFAREAARQHVNGLIASGESEEATLAYERQLNLPPIALDSGFLFGKSASVRFVPSLIVVDSANLATTHLAADPAMVARYVAAAR